MNLATDLVHRPALRSRNAVGYVTVRSWRAVERKDQIAAFKAEKRTQDMPLVETAAADVVAVMGRFVPVADAVVTCVPCGHSRRADCFGKRLARQVAAHTGLSFVECWEDRFCNGVSHPKEFAKLPPLVWQAVPDRFTIVVDDVATSGWHIEEALSALRSRGVPSMAIAWVGGTLGEDRDRGKPDADGQDDGGGAGSGSPFGRRGRVWRVPGC